MTVDWTGAAQGDAALQALIQQALREDVGVGDWTSIWTIPPDREVRAGVWAKAPLVLSGGAVAQRVFETLDPELRVRVERPDGSACSPGDRVLVIEGSARSILSAERTALNFLGRLSGIATLTRRFVEAVQGTGGRIVDTRKTTPGWRLLEKAAVRHGGGDNHRTGLYDMVLIKDNHIAASGGVTAALMAVAARNRAELPVEVEVSSLTELDEALAFLPRPDRILLDNMELGMMSEAVRHTRTTPSPHPLLEASGNLSLDRVRAVAGTGVDLLSVGALTHSAPVADFSLRVEEASSG